MINSEIYYQLGKRDAIAELFMLFRINGKEKTLKDLAQKLGDNPHATYYLNEKANK